MARKLTTKGTKRRRELLDYAARTFARDGYHTTSVASIVEGLHVGKGVFYWYFESKDELFIHILAEAQHELRLAQRDAIAGEHDPVRRIEQGIRASMRWLSEHRHLFVLTEFARTEARFAPLIRAGERQAVEDALPHVAAGISAGLLRREDPEVMTAAIIGVTSHLARVLVLEQGRDPDGVAQAAISFCRDGILQAAAATVAAATARAAALSAGTSG